MPRESYIDELVINPSNDRRQFVPDTTKFPYSCNGLLTFNIGEVQSFGTGFLLTDDLVATCAHNLLTPKGQGVIKHTNIQFYPSLNGSTKGAEMSEVLEYRYPTQYERALLQNDREVQKMYDLALLKLKKPIKRDQYIDLGTNFIFDKEVDLEVFGYPGEQIKEDNEKKEISAKQKGHGRGKIQKIEDGVIYHLVDTTAGQSGSAITTKTKDSICAIAVHKSGIKKTNQNVGTLLTPQNISRILKWQLEMRPSKIKVRDLSMGGQLLKLDVTNFSLGPNYAEAEFQLDWDLSVSWANKFKLQSNKMSFVAEREGFLKKYQLTSLYPLPTNQTTTITFELDTYGKEGYDFACGFLTQNRKKRQWSGGWRGKDDEESIGYWTDKSTQKGMINIDGKRADDLPHPKYYVGEKGWIKMELNHGSKEFSFSTSRDTIFNGKLPKIWDYKQIYPFIIMCEKGMQVQIK